MSSSILRAFFFSTLPQKKVLGHSTLVLADEHVLEERSPLAWSDKAQAHTSHHSCSVHVSPHCICICWTQKPTNAKRLIEQHSAQGREPIKWILCCVLVWHDKIVLWKMSPDQPCYTTYVESGAAGQQPQPDPLSTSVCHEAHNSIWGMEGCAPRDQIWQPFRNNTLSDSNCSHKNTSLL